MKAECNLNKRGFTIAELLIIAAIIGFLVAVSIPLFTAQLEKTRETVDIHTMRTAASLGQQFYYAGVTDKKSAEKAGMQWWKSGTDGNAGSNAYAIYLPDKGIFSDVDYNTAIDNGLKAYGKGTKFDGGKDLFREDNKRVYDPTLDYTNAVLQVSIFPNGSNKRVEVAWKKLQKGATRPFIGNGTRGKDNYTYNESNYPRMVIYLN